MEIPGVPESIPREKVVDFFKSIGIDPARCAGIELRHHGLSAEIFVFKDGIKVIDRDEPAMHQVYVKFD